MKLYDKRKRSLVKILLTFLSYIILSTSVYYTCSNDLESRKTSVHDYSCCTSEPCCDKLEKTLRVTYSQDSQREASKVKLFFFNNSLPATSKVKKSLNYNGFFKSVLVNKKLEIYKINCIFLC